jgi:diguanylate cyclase (GGDEF)-like protein
MRTVVQRHLQRSKDGLDAVLCLNLNRLRAINDGLGREFGDELLKQTAQRLSATVRDSDRVAKGGDGEFLVLLTGLKQLANIQRVAEKIFAALLQPIVLGGRSLVVSASVGAAVLLQDGEDADTLLNNAELAAHRRPETGGNTLQFFSADMGRAVARTMAIEAGLRTALQNDELSLVYQPKVSAITGEVTSYEALLRWISPELGAVSPAEFIPVAEESGLILLIGDWVLQTACRQMKIWRQAGFDTCISVNLSASQFLNRDVLAWAMQALAENGLAVHNLELEITETVLAMDILRVSSIIRSLTDIGISVAIDDFGTGYCSLQYLKLFRATTLKVDKTFVQNVDDDSRDAAIATAVISLGRNLGMTVVAEGVETLEQWRFLKAQHCDQIQGYLISKPLPPEMVESRYLTQAALDRAGAAALDKAGATTLD